MILPFAGELPVRGVTNEELTRNIERALIKAKLFEPQGFKIAVRKDQEKLLRGAQIDWVRVEKTGAAGFSFRNPNEPKR